MQVDINPLFGLAAAQGAFTVNRKDLPDLFKKCAICTALDDKDIASAFEAYTHAFHWCTMAATYTLVNLYALPKILHHVGSQLIQLALSIHLAMLSTLLLGGIGAGLFHLSRALIVSVKAYEFSTALFCSFGITALLGYGVPLFRRAVVKAYQMLNHPDSWKERIANLQQQFHRLPEMGGGFLQCNLWHHMMLQMSLIHPEVVLSHWQYLFISYPDYIWPMAAASTDEITKEQFIEMLNSVEEEATKASLNNTALPQEIKDNYFNRLQVTIKTLKKEDLPFADYFPV